MDSQSLQELQIAWSSKALSTSRSCLNQSRMAVLEMPTWNDYVTIVMSESGYVTKGAIYGTKGRKWASSTGFEPSSGEIKTLVSGFDDPTKLWTDGIHLAGKEYTCTRSNGEMIVGRECIRGTGCLIFRCRKCVVIAIHEEGAHPGGCHQLIMKLGDYLKDQGI